MNEIRKQILAALQYSPMTATAICTWIGRSRKTIKSEIQALLADRVIHMQPGQRCKLALGDSPKAPEYVAPPGITVTEVTPGHRVIKFGAGHKCQPALRQHLGIQGASSLCRG